MTKPTMTLAQYVKKRNGVPLGGAGALQAMLQRSLGAGSFAEFWRFWNPIWSYYLSRFVMRVLLQYVPNWLAIVLTFTVSGALHDIAVMAIKSQPVFLLTPWFSLMGVLVVLFELIGLNWRGKPFYIKAIVNLSCITFSFFITTLFISN